MTSRNHRNHKIQLSMTATGEPWKLQFATDSSYFMQSFWLAPESVPLVGQPFLVPTAVFYSIHPFSTLSVLLAFCCCSPRLHFISLCLRSWLPFLLPYPTPSKPLLPSPVFPMFSLLLSLFFILVLLSLN